MVAKGSSWYQTSRVRGIVRRQRHNITSLKRKRDERNHENIRSASLEYFSYFSWQLPLTGFLDDVDSIRTADPIDSFPYIFYCLHCVFVTIKRVVYIHTSLTGLCVPFVSFISPLSIRFVPSSSSDSSSTCLRHFSNGLPERYRRKNTWHSYSSSFLL